MSEAPEDYQDEGSETLLDTMGPEGIAVGERLVMRRFGKQVGVFAGSMAVVPAFSVTDRLGRRLAIATLANAGAAGVAEIAEAFGVHRNTVTRLAAKLAEGGVAALISAPRPAPPVRRVLTEEAKEIIAAYAGDKPASFIVKQIAERTGIVASEVHVRRLARAWRQEHLPEEPDPDPSGGGAAPPVHSGNAPEAPAGEASPEAPAGEASPEPPVILPAAAGPCVGLALWYPALAVLGVVEAARETLRLKAAERFGVRSVVLSLLFLFALGDPTIEAAKHLRRASFGALIGAGRAPCVKTLRRKLAEWVPQAAAGSFLEAVTRRFVSQGVVDTAYLYVDGHLQVYSGKANLAHHWSTKDRIVTRGLMRYFVGDRSGRPLLFVPGEASGSLAKAMPDVVAAVREVVGDRRFCVVFDRGGYDGELFASLKEQGIDFITYQKATPSLAREAFSRRECRFEGRRIRFYLAEDKVRVAGSGPWRRVVVRTASGHQTPILTSLGPDHAPARIACLMFARWRQENFFRYARAHLGIDALISYAYSQAPGDELVPNPAYKALTVEITAKRKELTALRASLGGALLEAPHKGGGGLAGLRRAEADTVAAIEVVEAEIEVLKTRRWHQPSHVPLAESGIARDLADTEAKTILDTMKIAAYNAEEWMLDRLRKHYANPHEIRDLLRRFAHLSGRITTTPTGVVVHLEPPDLPAHRRALEGFCGDLNALAAPFPGTALPVTYRVAVHHAEVAA